ncbi:MAG: hypothetical protein DMF27_14930 [Verrucomicrobia bacterium]|nr:MAG: hypothetical protein DMF27_14930 [Verrucomicrobiota bacterium]
MPKVRRRGVPRALLEHLWLRIEQREISITQLELFATWLEREPEVLDGKWFKRFPGMIVCGEGELVKTFLTANQIPAGTELF